jgi:hypothetical protein
MSESFVTGRLAEAVRRAEDACRKLNDACVAATDAMLAARAVRTHEASRYVMDCWHVASATARILSRANEYEPRTLAMLVAACRQIAMQCAWTCEMSDDYESLEACMRSCECASGACSELLGLLWDVSRTPPDENQGTPPHGSASAQGENGKTAVA